MEDSEGVLSFDFEGGLDVAPTIPTASIPSIQHHDSSSAPIAASNPVDTSAANNGSGRRSFRQTVCRHWLRSLCMKGDACGFLHQYDKARMPICRFFRLYGECREQDCVYKHTNEDIKECNMYKLGFCPNGPDCRYRHAKLPGPPPSVEEVLQKIQALTSFNYGTSNRFFQQRNSGYTQHVEKSQFPQGLNTVNQDVPVKLPMTDSSLQQQDPHFQQQSGQTQMQNLTNGAPNQMSRISTPLPQGVSRYFIVKSCNRENFELSIQQGVWATQRSNEAKLNEAFDSVENVILIFSVNRTRHFQGCAKMTSKIGGFVGGGNWKYEHGTAHYGRNFSVKWLKLCELSFHKTRLLKNPYNENLPVKISRDCQELEPSIGEELASLLYLEPDSELMEISVAAELKREEEKAKGVKPENGSENPDIVPFEDNEEEEEEEESEEDEEDDSFSQDFGSGMQGRGRGRGVLWPPNMPMVRGAGPLPGMMRFPPVMMGPDGFPIPDIFGVGPRGFPPFGPRFPGDFPGPAPGMMFHGRPPQPGFGMMMGPGRAPFMGGLGRGGRPSGMHTMFPPPPPPQQQPSTQNSNLVGKRDQRPQGNERRDNTGADQGRGQSDGLDDERQYHNHGPKAQEDESGSDEDEAPRRSRHGEGKKRRRDPEGDATTVS